VSTVKLLHIVSLLAVLSCGCDASPQGAGASSTTAGAAAASSSCAGLAAHWRDVWTAEGRPGLERRTHRATELAVTAWTRACAEVAAVPPSAADIETMRGIKRFADLKAMDAAASKGTLAVLLKAVQSAALETDLAFTAAPSSGVVECEEALVDAELCGDDVDKASVKAAAKEKNDGACAALEVLLAKKCAQ
jgi:hypothetical protein